MADDFNPCHVWLGIPPEEQPASYYRLLGINQFETSGDVIDSAADRQMAHLRTFQSGKHGEFAQQLLNEVAAARISLLDPKKKAAYDQQLRAKLVAASPAVASGAESRVAGESAIRRQPPRRPDEAALPPSLPTVVAVPQPINQWDDLPGKPGVKSPAGIRGKLVKSAASQRDARNRNLMVGAAVAVALVAVAGIGLFAVSGSSASGTLIFDWPANYRTDTNVSVDGVPLAIPSSGPWEYLCPPGSHRIVAEHFAYKFDTNVDLVAGGQQTVPADWKPKAMLVLSWPLRLRTGAQLKIDGRVQTISQRDPLEVPVEPGQRTILITRRGFDPIQKTALIAADGRELISIAAPPTTVKLVFDWPTDERKDAELTVDGSSRTIPDGSDSERFDLKLDPGPHVVRIARPGFESFTREVDLSTGTDREIKPTWAPEKNRVPTIAETPVPAEVASLPVKKLPVPAAAEQERIAKQLNDVYKTSQPGQKDPAKAQVLYDVAGKDGSTPAERYMLLSKGAEIAAMAGDLSLSLQGIDTLDANYDIDALEAKQKLLDKFIAAGKPDQLAAALPTAEQLVDQAVAADRFAIAIVLANSASKAVTKSRIATHKEVEERLSRRRRDIRLLEPIYAAARKSQQSLENSPTDPEANLDVGHWLCFYKSDWKIGLPMLAKGSDEKLRTLTDQEIKAPATPEQQAQIADAWWDLAQKETGIARDSLRLHAGNLYQAAMPNLGSALKKVVIEKRLAEIADLRPVGAATIATNPVVAGNPAARVKFPVGQWIDALCLVNLNEGIIRGVWTRTGAELFSDASTVNGMELPVTIEGSYDVEVDFTRSQGENDIHLIFPVGSHECDAIMSAYGGTISGLYQFDGHGIDDSPIQTRPGTIENSRRHRLLISVRVEEEDSATITASLDGKSVWPDWKGNPEKWTVGKNWAPSSTGRLAIGQREGQVTFHSVRLKMVSGHADSDPPFTPEPGLPTIISARWGSQNSWEDVTLKVRKTVLHGADVRANVDFFDSDPITGTVKQLEINYEKEGTKGATSMNEGEKWSKEDYANLKP